MEDQRNLLGQTHIWTPFLSAIERERTAHAYLVYGPPGSGVREILLFMAKALLCPETKGGFCDQCKVCRRVEHGNYSDLHFIEPQGLRITLDQVRGILELAYQYPLEGQYRIFIIDSPEKMNLESANLLLKVLEEPPTGTFFLLGSENYAGIIKTITSRCQGFRLRPFPEEEIQKRLSHQLEMPPEEALAIARLSDGSLGRAMEMAKEGFHEERQQAISLIEELVLKYDEAFAIEAANAVLAENSRNRERVTGFMRICLGILRDLAVLSAGGTGEGLIHSDKLEDLVRIAQTRDRDFWSDRIDSTLDVVRKIRSNLNIGLVLTNYFLELTEGKTVGVKK